MRATGTLDSKGMDQTYYPWVVDQGTAELFIYMSRPISFEGLLKMCMDVNLAGLGIVLGSQDFQRHISVRMMVRVGAVSIVSCQPDGRRGSAAKFVDNRVGGAIESISEVKRAEPPGTVCINIFESLLDHKAVMR